jgi:hypothetical protein
MQELRLGILGSKATCDSSEQGKGTTVAVQVNARVVYNVRVRHKHGSRMIFFEYYIYKYIYIFFC